MKATVEALAPPFVLETSYNLLQRLRWPLLDLRSRLCREKKAQTHCVALKSILTRSHLLFPVSSPGR